MSSFPLVFIHPQRDNDPRIARDNILMHSELMEHESFDGTLLFTSQNDLYDPWVLAQWLCEKSNQIPLIAVNPRYVHPFAVARKVQSIMEIYHRPVAINWITGVALSDGEKVGDEIDKLGRHERLFEAIQITNSLLEGKPVTFKGKYYTILNLQLPKLSNKYSLLNYVAGSSSFTKGISRKLEMVQLEMLMPDYKPDLSGHALAFGIVCAETDEEALKLAKEIYPNLPDGEAAFRLSLHNTDSVWKKQLADYIGEDPDDKGYWARPLMAYSETSFMVGSFERIKVNLRNLLQKKVHSLVIGLPAQRLYAPVSSIIAELKSEV